MAKLATQKTPPKPAPEKLSEALQDMRPASEQAPAQPKPDKPKVKRDRSTLYAKVTVTDTSVITVVPGCKGKRNDGKSAAGKRWAVMSANSGKTVAEVRAAYEQAKLPVKGTGSLQSDIRWNVAHNLITVS